MKAFSVAVVGVTGLVGQKMLEVLEARSFPIKQLIPIASQASTGQSVKFGGQLFTVQPLSQEVFRNVDIALFSAGAEVSREYAPLAAKAGVTVIDNSSAWRMEPHVPLVVPEVNAHTLSSHQGIIANPNCSTIQMVMVLHPLHRKYGLRRVVVSTYQSVTGSGKRAVEQLLEELRTGKASHPFYPYPIAFNCLPHIDVFYEDGYTKEEKKMINETRKILETETLPITATCVRVPVLGGHCESVNVELQTSFTVEQIRELLSAMPGVVVQDNPAHNLYPMPITARNRDEVFVGRIRRDESVKNGVNLWIVSDNLRKGAATNAVQIAEKLVDLNLV